MKYLKYFESYSSEVKSSDLSTGQTRELHKKSLEYLLDLSDLEKIKLKRDLENFARDNGYTLSELENPELVQTLIQSTTNEGLGDWIKDNWYNIVTKVAKYTGIVSLITFIGSMSLYWFGGYDTLDGVKIAATAWIISSIVSALKGLK